MGPCLRIAEDRGRVFRVATGAEFDSIKSVTALRAGMMGRVLCRILDEAMTCEFPKLERLVGQLSPANKKMFRDILLETKAALWNTDLDREFRFWE